MRVAASVIAGHSETELEGRSLVALSSLGKAACSGAPSAASFIAPLDFRSLTRRGRRDFAPIACLEMATVGDADMLVMSGKPWMPLDDRAAREKWHGTRPTSNLDHA